MNLKSLFPFFNLEKEVQDRTCAGSNELELGISRSGRSGRSDKSRNSSNNNNNSSRGSSRNGRSSSRSNSNRRNNVQVIIPNFDDDSSSDFETLIRSARTTGVDDVTPPEMCGLGIKNDFKRTVGTHWYEEMTNFNQKTVPVTLLMFISVIAPTLTFGAVYSMDTNNQIGTVETVLATTWVGIVYSLIGGMPVCIIGTTGPILAFTRSIVTIANTLDVPFRTLYAWISIWLLFYAIVAGFFDLTRIFLLATRFTDEIFATLIVSIFVIDAIGDPFSQTGILRYFDKNNPAYTKLLHDANPTSTDGEPVNYTEIALLSLILGFGTTALILFFRSFKTSYYFNNTIRTSIHDFAVTLAVVIATCIRQFAFPQVPTENLKVPYKFGPTYQCCDDTCTTFFPDECPERLTAFKGRPWFVDILHLNGKTFVPPIAVFFAIPGFLLLFLDNGITWHLTMHRSHNVKHGVAYNYDLFLNALFNLINGLFGLPWLVASTVPCLIHLNALADKDSKGKFISVHETRLTMFFSHILVGCSLSFLHIMKYIPVCVLYGVFLFMGLSILPGMQFWNRLLLIFYQQSKYPKTPYTRFMKKERIHLYTLCQFTLFICVFLMKNFTTVAIGFPVVTLLCIPIRLYILPNIFTEWELILLDGDIDDE